jgi:late competence protein required for DNA uptake (superfamily II DNA/RNA helicase)
MAVLADDDVIVHGAQAHIHTTKAIIDIAGPLGRC